jgi:AraC-like DNA-binding protein
MYTFSALAAAQGFFLAGLLFFSANKRGANRWLAVALVAFSLLKVGDVLNQSGAITRVPHLAYVFDWLIFLVGPLIYRYVLALTQAAIWTWRAWVLHAIPALLLLLMLSTVFAEPAAVKLQMLREDRERSHGVDPLLLLAAAQVLAYWLASVLRLRQFRQQLRLNFSNLDRLQAGWLALFLGANLLLWATWLTTLMIGQRSEWIESLATPVAVYGLGYVGLRHPGIFKTKRVAASLLAPSPRKYVKSMLSAPQMTDMQQRLDALMATEKPFLEDELSLDELAGRLSVAPHQLSQLFSLRLTQNFYDYINGLRVAEVKRCLRDPAYESQAILDLAMASGFSSKATFNAAFKKHTGVTPSVYRSGGG